MQLDRCHAERYARIMRGEMTLDEALAENAKDWCVLMAHWIVWSPAEAGTFEQVIVRDARQADLARDADYEVEGPFISADAYQGAISVIEAAKALKWNAVDGLDEHSDVIVERESWMALRRALRGR